MPEPSNIPQSGTADPRLIAYPSDRNAPEQMKDMDRVSILFKEYDLLSRREEQVQTFMQDVAKVTGLAFVGLCVTTKTETIGWYVSIVCAPVLIMGLLGVVAHCREITTRTGRQIANVEERLFDITGLPLLTYQTRIAINRAHKGVIPWCIGSALGFLTYAGSIWWIVVYIFWPHLFQHPARLMEADAALSVLISSAVLIVLYPARKLYKALAGRRQFNSEGGLARQVSLNTDNSMRDI